jgi:hypothetical protein
LPLIFKVNKKQTLKKEYPMKTRLVFVSAIAAALSVCSGFAWAADPTPRQEEAQIQQQEQVYGSQLMTPQERLDYRARMRTAKTLEEKNAIRKEHHQAMKERAASLGVTLPDEPQATGRGIGQGNGMGQGRGGMGPGGGMGSGGRRGR